MMDDEKKNAESPPDEPSESGETSLKGKGWDILVGGEGNAAEFGGDDPFDMNATPDDDEADSVLMMSAETEAAAPVPAEAYYDRGKGAEGAVPHEEADAEPPPRDLSPDELGAVAYGVPNERGVIELPPLGEGMPAASSGSLDDLGPTPPSAVETPAPALDDLGPTVPEGLVTDEPLPFGEGGVPFGESEGTFGGPTPVTPAPATAYVPPTSNTGEEAPIPVAAALPTAYARVDDPFADSWAPVDRGPELAADKEIQTKLVTQERVDALWEEINRVYEVVVNDVRGYFSSTEAALADLKKARELLMAGYDNFDNAEQLVMRVKARLRLEEKVRQWARTRGTWIAVYLIIWLLLLSSMSIVTFQIQEALRTQGLVPDWMAATILPGLFGGLGGVIGALWVLITHIAKKRDFDPIHTSWYITNPFLGFALGVVTYLILLVSSGLMNTSTTMAQIASNQTSPLIYALCVIVGFNQNVLWALVDRVIKAIIPPDEDKATVEESAVGQPDI